MWRRPTNLYRGPTICISVRLMNLVCCIGLTYRRHILDIPNRHNYVSKETPPGIERGGVGGGGVDGGGSVLSQKGETERVHP